MIASYFCASSPIATMSPAMVTVAARSVMRLATTSSRSPFIRISAGVKTKATPSPFGISSRTPLTARIFRTPVELSGVSLASMLPYHTATASALLKSMLSVSPHGQAWALEGEERIGYEVTRKRWMMLECGETGVGDPWMPMLEEMLETSESMITIKIEPSVTHSFGDCITFDKIKKPARDRMRVV